MKEMTSVAGAMMTDEERDEMEKELRGGLGKSSPISTSPVSTPIGSPGPVPSHPDTGTNAPSVPPSTSATTATATSTIPTPESNATTLDAVGTPTGENLKSEEKGKRPRTRLTPEQKKKIDEIGEERDKAMDIRISTLTTKLIDRLRPYVEAAHPGGKDDQETRAFEEKMRKEAEDLKLESFGVEVGDLSRDATHLTPYFNRSCTLSVCRTSILPSSK